MKSKTRATTVPTKHLRLRSGKPKFGFGVEATYGTILDDVFADFPSALFKGTQTVGGIAPGLRTHGFMGEHLYVRSSPQLFYLGI